MPGVPPNAIAELKAKLKSLFRSKKSAKPVADKPAEAAVAPEATKPTESAATETKPAAPAPATEATPATTGATEVAKPAAETKPEVAATPATVETKPEAAATPAAPVPEATPKATDTTIPQQAKVEAGENIDAKKDDVLPPPIAPVLNVAPPTQ